MMIEEENRRTLKKTCHSVHNESHLKSPRSEPGPPRCESASSLLRVWHGLLVLERV
jgi:hypothetical protein